MMRFSETPRLKVNEMYCLESYPTCQFGGTTWRTTIYIYCIDIYIYTVLIYNRDTYNTNYLRKI